MMSALVDCLASGDVENNARIVSTAREPLMSGAPGATDCEPLLGAAARISRSMAYNALQAFDTS